MRPRFLAVLLLIAACKSEPTQAEVDQMMASSRKPPPATAEELRPILDKYAPIVKAKIAAAEAIAADAKAAPPLTAAEPLATPLASPPIMGFAAGNNVGDTLFASLEHLLDPAAVVKFGFYASPALLPYMDLIAPDSKHAMQASALAERLAPLDGLKYALIVRVREHAASTIGTVEVNGAFERRYTPGFVSGDALFYDLTSQKRLGGFPFRFLAAGGAATRVNESDAETAKRLEDHLRDSVRTQLGEAIATFATGGPAPTATASGNAQATADDVASKLRAEFMAKHVAAIDNIVLVPGTPPVVRVTSPNPDLVTPQLRTEIGVAASKELGTVAEVQVVKKP